MTLNADIAAMVAGTWRERLAAAASATGRSWRELSLAAGLSPGYLFGILSEGKEPSASKLAALCETIGVSLTLVWYGVEMTAEAERILRLYSQLPEAHQKHLMGLFEAAVQLGGNLPPPEGEG